MDRSSHYIPLATISFPWKIHFSIQGKVGEFIATFKEYPPSAKAGSFTVDQVMETLKKGQGG